jgi:predicted restriction endonuclease
MKKALILSIVTLLFSIDSYSQKRRIPFFGKVKLTELCGSRDCRPDYGIKSYIHKKDKLYYNGNYNSILGRIIKNSIFDTEASGIGNITKKDVNYFVEHNGSGSLEKNLK